ncbi:hypothetical protein BDV28DRAFT_164739 [Aspergillus coremiiformis]|uniref:Uncharacterized protein n=1 Tax=Aspergillus coremiiformis TaxID=138285 RepID=A0A5N6ZA51_9EURO|nr:hypothetical protein BDV28DRAFT_164739 [Aspergillus coremiiformis]
MHPFRQQSQEITQLACLSLEKFSHTTTSVSHRGPFNWSHVFGHGDIICVFERHSKPTSLPTRSHVWLKIIRDHDILEQVDITHLTREATNQSQSSQSGHAKPIFAVVVKLPCLAVKYPRENACIRRFQIKFSYPCDFYSTLSLLNDIKCPFSESNAGSMPPTRKLTSSQWAPESISSVSYPGGVSPSVLRMTSLPPPIVAPSPLYPATIAPLGMTLNSTPGSPTQS